MRSNEDQIWTPPRIADRMAGMLMDALPTDASSVLEPSAGRGHLIEAVFDLRSDIQIEAVEIGPSLCSYLDETYGSQVHVRCDDILDLNGDALDCDGAIMAPPFSDDVYVDHIRHIESTVLAGGPIVSMIPIESTEVYAHRSDVDLIHRVDGYPFDGPASDVRIALIRFLSEE